MQARNLNIESVTYNGPLLKLIERKLESKSIATAKTATTASIDQNCKRTQVSRENEWTDLILQNQQNLTKRRIKACNAIRLLSIDG